MIYPLYFQREMEIRKALVNTFWNILKARNLSIENVVYKDLAGGFDANYYTPPKSNRFTFLRACKIASHTLKDN